MGRVVVWERTSLLAHPSRPRCEGLGPSSRLQGAWRQQHLPRIPGLSLPLSGSQHLSRVRVPHVPEFVTKTYGAIWAKPTQPVVEPCGSSGPALILLRAPGRVTLQTAQHPRAAPRVGDVTVCERDEPEHLHGGGTAPAPPCRQDTGCDRLSLYPGLSLFPRLQVSLALRRGSRLAPFLSALNGLSQTHSANAAGLSITALRAPSPAGGMGPACAVLEAAQHC